MNSFNVATLAHVQALTLSMHVDRSRMSHMRVRNICMSFKYYFLVFLVHGVFKPLLLLLIIYHLYNQAMLNVLKRKFN